MTKLIVLDHLSEFKKRVSAQAFILFAWIDFVIKSLFWAKFDTIYIINTGYSIYLYHYYYILLYLRESLAPNPAKAGFP